MQSSLDVQCSASVLTQRDHTSINSCKRAWERCVALVECYQEHLREDTIEKCLLQMEEELTIMHLAIIEH